MPLQQTSGNVTADAFGGGVAVIPTYIEQIFSTYLYTGNSSTQTITNGIDLAGKGGMVWIKNRTGGPYDHMLLDTARGTTKYLNSNTTAAESTNAYQLTSFNSNGFTLGDGNYTNNSAATYASWTFRKQPKFFDVVTYTGDGVDGRTVAHSLGVVPGCIIIKQTNAANNWYVYHRSFNGGVTPHLYRTFLNLQTANPGPDSGFLPSAPTSTVISLGINGAVNASGATYVAYIFAHNAGGFGISGTDNVISCAAFTTDGSGNATVNLGYEPQWVMIKNITRGTTDWHISDTMRGMPTSGQSKDLKPNFSDAEVSNPLPNPTATGFTVTNVVDNGGADTYIYIAIRRGPMKVPTDATKVYNGVLVNSSSSTQSVDAGFPVDLAIKDYRNLDNGAMWFDRLRGITSNPTRRLLSATTGAEANSSDINGSYQTGVTELGIGTGYTSVDWFFRRAPGFFDEVCYTGTGADPQTVAHNLGKAPELMIFKARDVAAGWRVWGGNMAITEYLALSETSAVVTGSTFFGSTLPTATSFYVGSGLSVPARTFVAYLFATCPGVSKVFSFTGNGTTQTINCGFTAGARFVLLKATSATGGWFTYDTARGMTVLTDPYLQLNTTAAEVATLGSVITATTGFTVNEAITTGVNTNGVSYIGLAIA